MFLPENPAIVHRINETGVVFVVNFSNEPVSVNFGAMELAISRFGTR